jgi:hypothetical protein
MKKELCTNTAKRTNSLDPLKILKQRTRVKFTVGHPQVAPEMQPYQQGSRHCNTAACVQDGVKSYVAWQHSESCCTHAP